MVVWEALVQFLPPALYLHVFLAYPDDRLQMRSERVVVGAAYAGASLSLARLLLGEQAEPVSVRGCGGR